MDTTTRPFLVQKASGNLPSRQESSSLNMSVYEPKLPKSYDQDAPQVVEQDEVASDTALLLDPRLLLPLYQSI